MTFYTKLSPIALDTGLKVWDVEAVIEGAGGVCAHWDGSPATSDKGKFAFAGDRDCLDEALVALRRASRD